MTFPPWLAMLRMMTFLFDTVCLILPYLYARTEHISISCGGSFPLWGLGRGEGWVGGGGLAATQEQSKEQHPKQL